MKEYVDQKTKTMHKTHKTHFAFTQCGLLHEQPKFLLLPLYKMDSPDATIHQCEECYP